VMIVRGRSWNRNRVHPATETDASVMVMAPIEPFFGSPMFLFGEPARVIAT
jgi:hypothetical protein